MVVGALSLWTCQKDDITETTTKELELNLKKKGDSCGKAVDVIGRGSSESKAKKDLKNKAVGACYNTCLAGVCLEGGCGYHGAKVGDISYSKDGDGFKASAKVECKCLCEDCETEKAVVKPAFIGSGTSKEEAIAAAKLQADEFCKTAECPRFKCDDEEEKCQFVESKIKSKAKGKGENWEALVTIEKCVCNCEIPDPTGEN